MQGMNRPQQVDWTFPLPFCYMLHRQSSTCTSALLAVPQIPTSEQLLTAPAYACYAYLLCVYTYTQTTPAVYGGQACPYGTGDNITESCTGPTTCGECQQCEVTGCVDKTAGTACTGVSVHVQHLLSKPRTSSIRGCNLLLCC
jgi:hypothetical protein